MPESIKIGEVLYEKGDKIEVLMHNSGTNKAVWHPAKITGFTCGDVGEDHPRINVELLTDGREVFGCHHLCVKKN